MNIKYNYLIGKAENLSSDYDVTGRPDPDVDGCEKLYDDLIAAFFTDEAVENHKQKYMYNPEKCRMDQERALNDYWNSYNKLNNKNPDKHIGRWKPPYYTIKYKYHDILLSADYIGPSVNILLNGTKTIDIINILNISRTIGGHIAWPRSLGNDKVTVNQARRKFYDRIDWTLWLVKVFYDKREEFLNYCESEFGDNYLENKEKFEKMKDALSNSREWFELIGNFKEFCKKFKLKGSFVDNENNIIWFAERFPIIPKNYFNYADKNSKAIESRNKKIVNELYDSLTKKLFCDGGEIYSRSDILDKVVNEGFDENEVDDIIESLLSVGFMNDTGEGCYYR